MKNIMFILISFLILPWLAGCSIPDSAPLELQSLSGKLINISLVSYTTTSATVTIQGQLPSDSAAPLSTIKIYTNNHCVGVPAGQGLANTFASPGIRADFSTQYTSSIYARSNVTEECYYLSDYTFSPGPVPDPSFTRTVPQSPTFDSYTPEIYGSAVSGSIVTFYSDSFCITPVGSGTAEHYNTQGVQINLTPNQTNTVFADASDIFNRKSNCVHMLDYIHVQSLVTTPTFSQIIPATPSNVTSSPVVKGVAPSGAVTVKLYNDAACSTKIGEGEAGTFYTPGIQISTVENVTTTVYAQSIDSSANLSTCMFLTNYLYDTIAPGVPTFNNTVPTAPTRLTTYPKIYGSSPSDTARVKFYNNADCSTAIGNGSKNEFELTGVTASLTPNSITTIYAQALDAAGNGSTCTLFLNYKHNTIPPDLPVLNSTDPISPNNISPNPLLNGNASITTTMLHFYSDEACTASIGDGTADDFNNAGIRVYTPNIPNTANITQINVQAEDEEGNLSECSGLGSYGYSTAKADIPTFSQAFPSSPSRASFRPIVFGTAPNTVSLVQLYSDALCTNFLGGANRAAFTTQGIQVTVPTNTSSNIYAASVDVYGNSSDCVYFTNYTHDNILPQAPTFLLTNPASPNNVTGDPFVKGNVITSIPGKPLVTNKIIFYDSLLCLTQIGIGDPSNYTGAGINVSMPPNTDNMMYAVATDAAGNRSGCTYLSNYIYSTNKPGHPLLSSSTPGTPSYSKYFTLKGTIAANSDIVSATVLNLYKDNSCSTLLANSTVATFTGAGVATVADVNATTNVYGQVTDVVGTKSNCNLLINFLHNQIGPAGVIATMNIDGSVAVNWQSDTIASPIPNYIVKRSKVSGGPYTIISASNSGNAFRDVSVVNGQTYYYVVAATNSTGISYDSAEASITVTGPAAAAPIGFSVTPGDSVAYLSWTLNGQNFNYKIYRATQSGGPYTMIVSNLVASAYTDTALNNDQNYYYVIAGVNANGESIQSNEVSVTPAMAPAAPTNLQIRTMAADPACGGSDSATLTWTAPSYYTRFIVRRGTNTGNLTDYRTGITAHSFVDCSPHSQPSNNTVTTYYRIQATWGTGSTMARSASSNTVSMYPGVNAPSVKANPGNNQILVTWLSVTNAVNYQVWRATSPGWPGQNTYTQLTGTFTGTVYFDNTAVNDQSYFYVVIANFASGASGYPSPEVSAMPKPNPTAPSNLLLTLDSASQMPSLAWKESSYANSYNIYRSVNGGSYSPIATALTGSYIDSLSTPGLYSYYVTANWGAYESPATNSVSMQFGMLIGPPTITTAASNLTLNWTAVATAVSYNILRSTNYNGPFTVIENVSSTTHVNSTTSPAAYPAVVDQGYYYSVQPVFAGNVVGQTSPVANGMLTASTIVSGLSVIGTTGSSVSLVWSKLPGTGKIYYVYRSTAVSGTYTKFTTNTTTESYTASTGLSTNTIYYFKVADSVCSTACLSEAVSALTIDSPTVAPTVKGGNNTVQISGLGVGASSYSILRSTDLVNFSIITSGLPTVAFDDNTAVNGTTYFYKIMAVYSDGSTQNSPVSLSVTPGITPQAPGQIYLTDNTTGSSVAISWAKVAGVTDYVIYYGNTSGGPYPTSQVSTGNNAGISGVVSGTDYFIVVRSRVGLIESGNSPELVVRPDPTTPAPTLAVSGSAVNVSWAAVTGATNYNVYRATNDYNYSTVITNTVSTSYLDTGVVSGIAYYYYVVPTASSGATLAPSSVAGPINVNPAMPVTALLAESSSGTSVRLSWTFSVDPNASANNVYRSTTAGGPYTLIQVTGNTINSYIDADAALVAGQSYYYVVRAVNTYGMESAASNEVSVILSAGPNPLAISPGNGLFNLSWPAVGGASQYSVYRSLVSSGPYGKIATTASLAYQDSALTNGVTYYYVVAAEYANGNKSIYSNEVSGTAIKTMNLRVPIEVIDQGLASANDAPITFERSRTSLETTAYDGTVSYDFEIVVTNIGGASSNVDLLDESDNVVSQIAVPAGSVDPIRLSNTLTPVAGFHTYRIRVAQTANYSDVQVYSSKIWVNQTNATKTKLYFPLLSPMNSPVNGDLFAASDSTTDETLTTLFNSDEYVRDVSNLAKIPDYNGWEFESVVSTYGSKGVIGLYNTTTGQPVDKAQITFNDAEVTLFNSPFDEGVSQFSTSNNSNKYKVAYRCYLDCDQGPVNVYKSGLWVKLENMTAAEILIRQSTNVANVMTQTHNDRYRTSVDLSLYSNPVAYFRTYAKAMTMGDNGNIRLITNGTGPAADSGSANLSLVANSTLFINEQDYTTKQIASPMTVTNQSRIMTEFVPSIGGLDIRSSFIVIRASP